MDSRRRLVGRRLPTQFLGDDVADVGDGSLGTRVDVGRQEAIGALDQSGTPELE